MIKEEVLEYICAAINDCDNAGMKQTSETLRAVLQDLETIKQIAEEYSNGWIPCSEKLPEKNIPVLCWVTSTTIASGSTYIIGSCSNKCWFLQTYEIGHHHFPVKDYEVIGWQPLPAPYKEGHTDEYIKGYNQGTIDRTDENTKD